MICCERTPAALRNGREEASYSRSSSQDDVASSIHSHDDLSSAGYSSLLRLQRSLCRKRQHARQVYSSHSTTTMYVEIPPVALENECSARPVMRVKCLISCHRSSPYCLQFATFIHLRQMAPRLPWLFRLHLLIACPVH